MKSSSGLLAAAGKVCSRNVGQSDLESTRTRGQKCPAQDKTDLVISRKSPSFAPVLKHSCEVRRRQMPRESKRLNGQNQLRSFIYYWGVWNRST